MEVLRTHAIVKSVQAAASAVHVGYHIACRGMLNGNGSLSVNIAGLFLVDCLHLHFLD